MLVMGISAHAHEVRPAFLKITETQTGEFSVLWKQPVIEGKRLKIDPVFPDDCEVGAPVQTRQVTTVSESFSLRCGLRTGEITLAGLETTLTDAFVEITYLDHESRSALLKPAQPNLNLAGPPKSAASQYLKVGVDHILMGWDHLLFVIGLTLLVSRRQILGVATSFTLAHSLTLALAAFNLISLPSRPVEILIALSIVLLGVEIMRKHQGKDSLSIRRPYLIGFIIGLIHGCGFASALSDIGLPEGTELLALLLFNIGVELGQFAIIGLLVLGLFALSRVSEIWTRRAELTATYLIAGIAMFWFIDRAKDYFV
jgi:hydrogenase/urease accessory protein HupE